MDGGWQGKRVAVTGGAGGIGLCVVHAFAERGARVAFADLDARSGRVRQRRLEAAGRDAAFTRADLGTERGVRAFAAAALRRLGGLDVLVNNVGITDFEHDPLTRGARDWGRILDVNLTSYFLCAREFGAALKRSRGAIVNIASTRFAQSEKDGEPYAASKGGVVALTHALAVSLGGTGVRVNCISPGWIDTSRWKLPPRRSPFTKKDHEQHPAGRMGLPEDVAEACLFLAGPKTAGFITGANLVVDGGMTRKMIYA